MVKAIANWNRFIRETHHIDSHPFMIKMRVDVNIIERMHIHKHAMHIVSSMFGNTLYIMCAVNNIDDLVSSNGEYYSGVSVGADHRSVNECIPLNDFDGNLIGYVYINDGDITHVIYGVSMISVKDVITEYLFEMSRHSGQIFYPPWICEQTKNSGVRLKSAYKMLYKPKLKQK